ncbi:hypothetical protein ABE485_15435 [Achromobacter spanius]|uniref:hypothetical protein n=1 Tax=Achromobacter spanius TaxID=217203 RepID=UPI0032095360
MSYEYRLMLSGSGSAQRVLERLKASEACSEAGRDEVCLKDRRLNTLAAYDMRLMNEDGRSLWLEVNFRSAELFRLVEAALDGLPCRCLEDGDPDDEVALVTALA